MRRDSVTCVALSLLTFYGADIACLWIDELIKGLLLGPGLL